MINQILLGDCLDLMAGIPANSIDMILCDLPYGTTSCKWDSIIPPDSLWAQYERVIKDTSAIVLTAAQPFTSYLVMYKPKLFKYQWVWVKTRALGFLGAKLKPMGRHEDVLIFSKGTTANNARSNMLYNPQNLIPFNKKVNGLKGGKGDSLGHNHSRKSHSSEHYQEFTNYPSSVLEIASEGNTIHPTQKPVALFEYLIRTYTNPGDTVLDNCAGSGTTAIACMNSGRNFICMEKDPDFYAKAKHRIESHENYFLL